MYVYNGCIYGENIYLGTTIFFKVTWIASTLDILQIK
jgi:hypothetical protein